LEGFLEVLVNIFKVFLFIYHQKSFKLGNVSSQAIVKALFAIIDAPSQSDSGFTHNPAFLAVIELKLVGVFTRGHPFFLIL